MTHSPRFLQIVNDAKQRIKEIEAEQVKNKLDHNEKVILIDVREDNEWEQGHITGAIHLGKGILERDIEKIVPETDTEIILYCGGGYRTALAADNLQKMGFTNVFSMAGGWRRWNELEFPITH